MDDNRIVFDTSILVPGAVRDHPAHAVSLAYAERVQAEGAIVCVSPQICREFVSTLTRKPVSGMSFTVDAALSALNSWTEDALLLDETSAVVDIWRRLVGQYQVKGKQVHDCNIVATMLEHGVTRIATRNSADFDRYSDEIDVIPIYS